MSLNDIKLSPSVIAALYGNKLMDSSTAEARESEVNTLIITRFAAAEKEKEIEFLNNILAACKLKKNDFHLAETDKKKKIQFESLIEKSHPRNILVFGIAREEITAVAKDLPEISANVYDLNPFQKGHLVFAPALNFIADNKSEKMKLWNSLKTLYGIE